MSITEQIVLRAALFKQRIHEASKIRDRIYLSSLATAANKGTLDELGITHIVCVCPITPCFKGHFEYFQVPIQDDSTENMLKYFGPAFRFIDAALSIDADKGETASVPSSTAVAEPAPVSPLSPASPTTPTSPMSPTSTTEAKGSLFSPSSSSATASTRKPTKVLVHCAAGISRSATLVIGYLMYSEKLSFSVAMSDVQERRSSVWPNPAFRAQLKLFEDMGPRLDVESTQQYREWIAKGEQKLILALPAPAAQKPLIILASHVDSERAALQKALDAYEIVAAAPSQPAKLAFDVDSARHAAMERAREAKQLYTGPEGKPDARPPRFFVAVQQALLSASASKHKPAAKAKGDGKEEKQTEAARGSQRLRYFVTALEGARPEKKKQTQTQTQSKPASEAASEAKADDTEADSEDAVEREYWFEAFDKGGVAVDDGWAKAVATEPSHAKPFELAGSPTAESLTAAMLTAALDEAIAAMRTRLTTANLRRS